jgi:fructose-1,6-bisphosphatase/inositol monophosphatase family enzyme
MFKGTDFERFERVRKAVKLPLYGGDCYAYGLLASGFADLVIEASLKPYDYMAIIPVIEGAGGRMSDWQGKPLGLESDGRVLAAGDQRLVAPALALLGG